MLSCSDVEGLVQQMQTLRSELPGAEAKDARRGLPQRIYESLSAFGNRRGGGVIVFGLEDASFRTLGGLDIAQLEHQLTSLVDQRLSYPLRLDFATCEISGNTVLAVAVPECPQAHKPVYYRNKGLVGGSYLRVGNSNHVLAETEVRALLRSSDRDTTDILPAEGARFEDLAQRLIDDYRAMLQDRKPGSGLLGLPDRELLRSVQAVVRVEDLDIPTAAGILFFTGDPTRWLPGAFVSFLQFSGTEIGGTDGSSVYLDNQRLSGSLPRVVEQARLAVLSRISKRALLEGFVRREIPEYPDWAYREAIVNAVAHRDYGIAGSHTQIRLFADRLEVQSPGGLFGTVSEQNIENEQSTRNHAVVRLLEDHGLVEQRGIGINRMVQEMLTSGLRRPVFRDALTSFSVVLENHTMMDDDAYRWISGFADYPLKDAQRMALVYAWRTGSLANRDYVRLNSVTSVRATRDLRTLVRLGLLRLHGTRGSAYYTLARIPRPRGRRRARAVGAQEENVLTYVRLHGRITNAEGRRLLGIQSVHEMRRILRRMVRSGLLSQQGTSKQLTYYEIGPSAA